MRSVSGNDERKKTLHPQPVTTGPMRDPVPYPLVAAGGASPGFAVPEAGERAVVCGRPGTAAAVGGAGRPSGDE